MLFMTYQFGPYLSRPYLAKFVSCGHMLDMIINQTQGRWKTEGAYKSFTFNFMTPSHLTFLYFCTVYQIPTTVVYYEK